MRHSTLRTTMDVYAQAGRQRRPDRGWRGAGPDGPRMACTTGNPSRAPCGLREGLNAIGGRHQGGHSICRSCLAQRLLNCLSGSFAGCLYSDRDHRYLRPDPGREIGCPIRTLVPWGSLRRRNAIVRPHCGRVTANWELTPILGLRKGWRLFRNCDQA